MAATVAPSAGRDGDEDQYYTHQQRPQRHAVRTRADQLHRRALRAVIASVPPASAGDRRSWHGASADLDRAAGRYDPRARSRCERAAASCGFDPIGATPGLGGALVVIMKMLNIGPPCVGLPVCHGSSSLSVRPMPSFGTVAPASASGAAIVATVDFPAYPQCYGYIGRNAQPSDRVAAPAVRVSARRPCRCSARRPWRLGPPAAGRASGPAREHARSESRRA
jgi:hypothetical protein